MAIFYNIKFSWSFKICLFLSIIDLNFLSSFFSIHSPQRITELIILRDYRFYIFRWIKKDATWSSVAKEVKNTFLIQNSHIYYIMGSLKKCGFGPYVAFSYTCSCRNIHIYAGYIQTQWTTDARNDKDAGRLL